MTHQAHKKITHTEKICPPGEIIHLEKSETWSLH